MLADRHGNSDVQDEWVVLAVDDDVAVLNSLVFSLEIEGFRVRPFASPGEMLAMETFPARGCIVIDYRLPGMDGLMLLHALRARGVLLPAIFITATNGERLRSRSDLAHIEVLDKPLLGSSLCEAIQRLRRLSGKCPHPRAIRSPPL